MLRQRIATAFSHLCLWLLLQIAEHIHRLEADLQDARQAREQAEFDRDGAVAEGVHLTQQRDKFQKMVQDLVQENVAFKAETAVSQLSL